MLSLVSQCSVTATQHLIQSAYHVEISLWIMVPEVLVYIPLTPLLFGSVAGTASWLGRVAKNSCSIHGDREAKRERKRPPSQGTHQ